MTAAREMTDPELLAIADEALPEVVRQAELKMGQTLTIALAALQRASGLAAAFGAASAGLLAAAGAMEVLAPAKQPLIAGLTIGAALFLIAASLCAAACTSCAYYAAGNEPASVWMSANNLTGMNRHYCRELDLRLKRHAGVLARTSRWTNWGQAVAVAAPFTAVAAYLLASAHPGLFSCLATQTC